MNIWVRSDKKNPAGEFVLRRNAGLVPADGPPPMDSPLPPAVGWLRQAGGRVLLWWPAKMLGTMLGMAGFFAVYFWVLHHPAFPVTIMPLTAPDRLVGFRAEALPAYLSLWFYVSLAPALIISRRELVSFALAACALAGTGLIIFYFWPTTVQWPEEDWSPHPAVAFLKMADASGNACPSLHVAFAVFTAVWLARLLPQIGAGRGVRGFNWLWCAGILYSTVAIRQHVALDVLAGSALGAAVAAVNLRWLRGSG